MKILEAFAASLAFVLTASVNAQEQPESTAGALQDNSFFIEEAYNQEAGVVQHIWNATLGVTRQSGNSEQRWDTSFTQEWPVVSQAHQFSYTVPASFINGASESESGIGDVLLNYRYQALTETAQRPAFAPRFSLVLPTGDEERGLGNGTVGYQTNLPVSKIVSDRWTVHANAGATLLPDVEGVDLVNYNLGGSAIFAVSRELNLMLECVGFFTEEPDGKAGSRRQNAVILSPGVRYAFNFENGSQIVGGLASPIGLTSAAPDYGVVLYLSIEHFFVRPANR